jgi:hypothetical protein
VTLLGGVREGSNKVYAFIMGIHTPETIEKAGEPLWDVRIVNRKIMTLDAAIEIEAPSLVVGLFLQNPSLSWISPQQKGETSVVTISISLDRRVEKVKAILITLPERYKHDIQHRNQLKNLNRFFPVAIDIEWRNFENLGWVRILANDGVGEERDFLPAGSFSWQFPVRIPKDLPVNMEWYLTMCMNFLCDQPKHDSVLASFPVPNVFPIRDARPWGSMATTALAQRQSASNLVATGLMLLLVNGALSILLG